MVFKAGDTIVDFDRGRNCCIKGVIDTINTLICNYTVEYIYVQLSLHPLKVGGTAFGDLKDFQPFTQLLHKLLGGK